LARRLASGLHISTVTYVELAPVFAGAARLLDEFLLGLGVVCEEAISEPARQAAFSAWSRHLTAKRAGAASRRPVADVFIGAMAMQHDGLITRNAKDFKSLFPKLHVIVP
jgi:predicted nucleic acid-binding protein